MSMVSPLGLHSQTVIVPVSPRMPVASSSDGKDCQKFLSDTPRPPDTSPAIM